MQQYISQSLESFQSVFSRSSTWLLFCAIVIGFMGAGEMIGVTSLCRFWLLDELGYYRLLRFFRSKAYVYGALLDAWQDFVNRQGKSVEVAGRAILLGDHTAVIKDGRKMPGVVSMHESSETQTKPGYFRAQCWGSIGILIGSLSACFCCPLQLQIHQGWAHLGLNDERDNPCRIKLTDRLAAMAIHFAVTNHCLCYLVLDAFFSTGGVFRACHYYSIQHQARWVEVLVKAKNSYVGYFPAPPKPASRPGPQPLYGEKVCLRECFDHLHLFETVTCQVYGKTESIRVMTLTLLWRPIADQVLFILAVTSKGPMVLMSSDLTLSAIDAVELYCARTRIEIMFAMLKHVIGAFKFRFWTKKLPKHSRRPFSNRLLKAPQPQDIHTVQACWRAYEIFVLCASIALGLMQLIALQYQDTIWSEHSLYLRTQSRDLPSEKTVKQILAPLFLKQFFRLEENGMIQQIRARLMTVSDEIDDD